MWDNVHQDVEHWMERIYAPAPAAAPAPASATSRPRMPEWELANWDVESLRRCVRYCRVQGSSAGPLPIRVLQGSVFYR